MKILILCFLFSVTFLYSQDTPPYINDTYEISTLEHLRWVSETPSSWKSNFKLMDDIDAGDTKNWNDGKGWKPLGRHNVDSMVWFRGNFDGNHHTISNLFVYRTENNDRLSEYCGFFGYIFGSNNNHSKIKNLGIENANITGVSKKSFTGGLVGYCYYADFENCYSTGKVKDGAYCGLLGGWIINSNINHCYALGSVESEVESAGFIGNFEGYAGCVINECFVIADVKSVYRSAGFCYKFTGQMTNCFAICNISVDAGASGFIADGLGASKTVNCYSASRITYKEDSGIFVFSEAKKAYPYKNINCFCDNEICKDTVGRQVIPKNTAEMKTKETFTAVGWDFDSVWAISPNLNNGYPYLQFAEKFFTPVNEEIYVNSEICVSPNPAGDLITITMSDISPMLQHGVANESQILIYSTLGEKVMAVEMKNFSSLQRMNIESLPKGIYFVKIGGETTKFVKM
jgi:hypothetical protein